MPVCISRCDPLSALLACGQKPEPRLQGTGRDSTFAELGKGFSAHYGVSFLEARAGSRVCAADVLEHEKEPR